MRATFGLIDTCGINLIIIALYLAKIISLGAGQVGQAEIVPRIGVSSRRKRNNTFVFQERYDVQLKIQD